MKPYSRGKEKVVLMQDSQIFELGYAQEKGKKMLREALKKNHQEERQSYIELTKEIFLAEDPTDAYVGFFHICLGSVGSMGDWGGVQFPRLFGKLGDTGNGTYCTACGVRTLDSNKLITIIQMKGMGDERR